MPVKIAYIVSRFPAVTETFIARELTQVAADGRLDVSLLALFPSDDAVVPEDARPWLDQLVRGTPFAALVGVMFWSLTAPAKLVAALAAVVLDYRRRPSVLVRALVTVAVSLGLARHVRREGIRHVHAHFATYPALAAWLIGRLTGAEYSFTGHAHDLYVHQLGLARRAREARFVVAISDFNRGYVAAIAGCETRQVLVRYGLDLTRYRLRTPPPVRRSPRIAMVSGFREYKGHRVLIDALAADRTLANVAVILVGDGPLRREIEQYARTQGVSAQLQFRGWMVEEEVRELLLGVDALVQPSVVAAAGDSEGLPNTLIEAMALGVPVVGSDVTGVPELIDDGENGLLFQAGSGTALSWALRRLIDDPESARERVVRGRQRVERQHDLRREAGLLVELFADAQS